MATTSSSINYKNINWLRNLKAVGPTGRIDGHLIAAVFDDVSVAHGQVVAQQAATQAALDAALARIAALEKKV